MTKPMPQTDTIIKSHQVDVAVDLPAYSRLAGLLTYRGDVPAGSIVRIPLGKKSTLGIVWRTAAHRIEEEENVSYELKEIDEVFEELAPLDANWLALVHFTAKYYQRSLGEVALQALPPGLRKLNREQLQRRLVRLRNKGKREKITQKKEVGNTEEISSSPDLTPEQAIVFEELRKAIHFFALKLTMLPSDKRPSAFLLHGATGSGKTEVYMRATAETLQASEQAQVLVLVPEINLTPQLEGRYRERFPDVSMVTMHSGISNSQRLQSWLQAHMVEARIVLGTRMAIFASMPSLRMIIVDEEHDPSYKQYEGARWSARDLAVWRGQQEGVPVLLGSATPSVESCLHARRGDYKLLTMPSRIGSGEMPEVHIVDMQRLGSHVMLAPALVNAIQERVDRGEQSLILLNRRGYAPVLFCASCGWKSQCPHCSAYRVFHRADRTLRCHHCGFSHVVPQVCPDCGDADLQPIGRGTERLEEQLRGMFIRQDGRQATVLRIDADSTRLAGSLKLHLQQAHEGEVDILVGTQMIAKGHDFRNVTLVAAVNPDTALFSSDFRAGERLFALLLQAAGRAGRDEVLAESSEFWVQTMQPMHPLYQALKKYDFAAFISSTLEEREMSAMPPYSYLALCRAEGRSQGNVLSFLKEIHVLGQRLIDDLGLEEKVMLYPPIPAAMQRVAGMERAQMLVESSSRKALQFFLQHWQVLIHDLRTPAILRWAIDVDPQSV